MPRNKHRKRLARLAEAAQVAAHSLPREEWARFTAGRGSDIPHRAKKGKGSYLRKGKHGGAPS